MSSHEISHVFATNEPVEAGMVQLALSEAGIKCRIDNEHQAGLTGVLEMKVYVPSDDADQAREVIAELDALRAIPPRSISVSLV